MVYWSGSFVCLSPLRPPAPRALLPPRPAFCPAPQGYVDAARAFEAESGAAPGVDLGALTDRMEIRRAVAGGDVEAAIERVNDLDPEVRGGGRKECGLLGWGAGGWCGDRAGRQGAGRAGRESLSLPGRRRGEARLRGALGTG